jgi:hypothetical protein
MSLFSFITDLFKSPPKPVPTKVLFIVKQRTLPHYDQVGRTVSTGLKNSAAFVVSMLNTHCSEIATAKLAEVVDNNCIDREVTLFKPDIVIIEALWVVPDKFDVLCRIHPKVQWIIRLHSDTPFLANEGIAIEWIRRYAFHPKVRIAANSERIYAELQPIIGKNNLVLLPNYYPVPLTIPPFKKHSPKGEINIGCFGAIRPMKNHLIQALSAIRFAEEKKLKLNFHINGNRTEERGDPVLKNIRSLFYNSKHELIEHPWKDHEEFLKTVELMDISMQVSLSKTYNIVIADSVVHNIPVVVSPEIKWVNSLFQACATSSYDIVKTLHRAWSGRKLRLQQLNSWGLNEYNEWAKWQWKTMIRSSKTVR